MKTRACSECGRPISKVNVGGVCQSCRHDKRYGSGICHMCGKPKPVPKHKDPRWFRCAECDDRLETTDDLCDSALRWLDGFGVNIEPRVRYVDDDGRMYR